MCKAYSAVLALTGIMAAVLFPSTLSGYTVDGSVVTLASATDFNADDNTTLIQSLLNNTSYTKIIIPPGTNNASWKVRPLIFYHNNTEIHLNTNTVLEAKPNGYPNANDCVLSATSLSNIRITGDAGSKIFMQKAEYATMAAGEWRHAVSLRSCSIVTVSGLTLANTGGDGIYLGDATGAGYCSNVTVANVAIDNAGRNGISVVSVDGLSITGCTFKNTKGEGNIATLGPWAGIDLEPNNSSEQLKNIMIANCAFLNNAHYGFLQYTRNLNGSTGILKMTVKECIMQGNSSTGIAVFHVAASLSDSSSVVFQDCTIKDNKGVGIWIGNKARDAGILSFTNCYVKNNNLAALNTAIKIENFSDVTE